MPVLVDSRICVECYSIQSNTQFRLDGIPLDTYRYWTDTRATARTGLFEGVLFRSFHTGVLWSIPSTVSSVRSLRGHVTRPSFSRLTRKPRAGCERCGRRHPGAPLCRRCCSSSDRGTPHPGRPSRPGVDRSHHRNVRRRRSPRCRGSRSRTVVPRGFSKNVVGSQWYDKYGVPNRRLRGVARFALSNPFQL